MTDVSQSKDGDLGATGGSTDGQSTGDKLKQQFQSFKGQASDKARDAASQGKDKATGALDDAARFLHETARTVEEKVGPQYGRYVHSAAESVESFAGNLKDKDVEELVEQGRELVRKSPAVAIGVAAGLGFVLARLVKAGMDYTPTGTTGSTGMGATGSGGSDFGSTGMTGKSGTTGIGTTGPTGTTGTGTAGLGGSTTALPTGGTSVTGSTEPSFPA